MELDSLRQDLNIALGGNMPDNVVDEASGVPPESFVIIE